MSIKPTAILRLACLAGMSLAACFGGPTLAHDDEEAHRLEARQAVPNVPVILLDFKGAPDLAGYAYRVKARCEAYYAPFAHFLASEGYTPPSRFRFIFKEGDGVAGTSGTLVEFSARFFRQNPQDHGAAIHEMVHILQNYPRYDPGWLVEGVADYVRFYMYEPASARPNPDPERTRYTDGYREAAAFLDWVTRTHDKGFVPAVNAALREDRYTPAFWKQRTGKELDTLWTDYIRDLKARRAREAAGREKTARG